MVGSSNLDIAWVLEPLPLFIAFVAFKAFFIIWFTKDFERFTILFDTEGLLLELIPIIKTSPHKSKNSSKDANTAINLKYSLLGQKLNKISRSCMWFL